MKLPRNARLAALSCLLLMAASLPAAAVELIPMVGWRFGGSFDGNNNCYCNYYYNSLNLDSSASYGAMLDIPFSHGPYALEIYYSHQNTTLQNGLSLSPPVHDMDVDVIHLGVSAALPTSDRNLSWLFTLSGGATILDAANTSSQSYPSLGLGVGLRYMANEHLGLRADLRGIFSFMGSGNAFLACGYGCSGGYYSSSVLAQGEASLGLVLRF